MLYKCMLILWFSQLCLFLFCSSFPCHLGGLSIKFCSHVWDSQAITQHFFFYFFVFNLYLWPTQCYQVRLSFPWWCADLPEALATVNKYSSDGTEIISQKLQLNLNSLTAALHLSWCPAVFNLPSESTSSLYLDYFELEVREEKWGGDLWGVEKGDGGVAIGRCCSSGVSYCNTLLRNAVGQILRQGKKL